MPMVRFDKDVINISQVVRLGFTQTAFQQISKSGGDPERFAQELSRLHRAVLVPEKTRRGGEERFVLNTVFGCFVCVVNTKTGDSFSVIAYQGNDLHRQNMALKYGLIFNLEGAVCAEVLFPKQNLEYKYLDGAKYEYNALDCGSCAESFGIVMGALRESEAARSARPSARPRAEEGKAEDSSAEEEEEEMPEKVQELLTLAEQYALLASELEEQKAQELGRVGYRSFTASGYIRTDRIAYEFAVDPFDAGTFKEGVQVEVAGEGDERLGGEIIALSPGAEGEPSRMTILFNRQIDYSALPPFGWISLSFSTVNRDVQLEAVELLKSRTAPARYLPDVIGRGRPAGFEKKDISDVVRRLNEKKYPPNASQMTAIERGIDTKDVFLVMGPPGTGKTTVILEWVKYFVGVEHKRVLVSSQNNKAVDNVLARLAEEKDIDVIRIGSEAKLQSEVIPYMFENKLAALARQIDERTARTRDALQKAVTEWNGYLRLLTLYESRLAACDGKEKELRREMEARLLPRQQERKRLYEKYREAQADLRETEKKADECRAAAKAFDERSPLMKRVLRGTGEKNLQLLKEYEDLLGPIRRTITSRAARYNASSDAYRDEVRALKERFMAELSPLREDADRLRTQCGEALPACPGIGRLFEGICPEGEELPFRLGEWIDERKADLNAELARCRLILSGVNEWRDEAVDRQNYALNEIVLESVDLVGATCIGINSQKRFANLHFDVTIIDEAGQIQVHNALVPMSVSNKLIMLGDYKQIPPSADQEMLKACWENGIDTELLEKSLFEKMFTALPPENAMMLDTQYRMPGEIADVISGWFYGGGYLSPDSKRNLPGLLPGISEKPFVLIDTSEADGRHEERTEAHGTYNMLEAEICGQILAYLARCAPEIDFKEIGIISAYKDQVAQIKKCISPAVGAAAGEMAATLDSFQGQERDLILYSFTKSSDKPRKSSRIGFLNELRRLNVAMSRCKKTLILIGDFTFLSECENEPRDEEGKPVYERSEKEFSDFIRVMRRAVDAGSGETVPYEEFLRRIRR